MDLLSELKRRQASVPVLMISAYADAMAEQTILQLGALEFMKKPIRRQELIIRAARAVGGSHERSECKPDRAQQSNDGGACHHL
jgi:two-component system nitrogen regulation response regulator NtrX